MPTALRILLFLLLSSLSGFSQNESVTAPPSLPVIDSDACPFEGCTFGKWTVTKDSPLYTSWKSERTVSGKLSKGDVVTGITGVHITRKPDRIRVRKPVPELGLKAGDIVLRYMYQGEGFANIWASGHYIKSADCSFIAEKNGDGCLRDCPAIVEEDGLKEWWVQVKAPSGQIGWTQANGNFDGMDSLAAAKADGLSGN